MSTQQDIYAAGFENRPPMLNKENYVSWSSRLLRYAKSRPNGKLIHNSIINGPYVRQMILEPGDPNREVPVNETFHVQIDDELIEKELKPIEADDQVIQTILLDLPEDIYAVVDSCETAQKIWLRVQQMMKGFDIGIQEKKAKLFNEWERFTSNDGESIESYYHRFLKLMNDLKRNKHFPEKIASNLKFLNNLQPEWSRHVTIVHQTKDLHTADYTQLYDFLKYNQKENYMQQPMPNPEDITDPTTAMNMALALMAKEFKLNYSTPTKNNQRISSNPRNRQIAQPGMNMGQDRQMQMIKGNGENQFIQYAGQNVRNQNGNGNLVAARGEGNATGHNGNQIRCYNCRGVVDLDEVEEVNANCILMANLQQASISGTQTDKAPVYDSDGLAEVHNYEDCYDNEIFNMFTQEDQYTELLEPIPESHQVPQNDNNVISDVTRVEQSGGTVEQHPANVEETRVLYDSLYHNLAIEVEKVNTVNQAAKFVGDFKSLAKKVDESLAKQKALELEIERLLKAVKLENENVELEFQVLNYTKENAHLKTTYKILFDSISVTRTQTKTIIASLQNKLHNTIYENAKLRAQLFNKVSVQKDNTRGTSTNTKFAKQSIVGNLSKVGETHALSKPVTSNSTPTPQESKVVKNDKVIAPGMFRINLCKTSREEKHVPNKVRASARTKPITVSQPPIFTKKEVNSDSNGLSSIGIDNTKTRRPQPRSNTNNDRVPSASKSSCTRNKGVEVEEHHLLFSKNKKHMSSACNNVKLATQNVKSKVVCAMCKYCLISVNHDVVQLCLWCVDSGCSKHMTENLNLLINFVWKFLGTVHFGNDHVPAILGFGDLQWGNILITRVYFVEGLGYKFFSVWQLCDSDLEVAFRRNACFVRNLEGVDLLSGNRTTNLYTINLHEMVSASPICLMARASSTKSWLWHQRLSHCNFDTINDLAKNDLVSGLPKFKYHKEHLCPSCEQGKSKRASHPPKPVPNSRQRLHLFHMDLCGPMRIASINGKRTDNSTEFKNQVLKEYFDNVGISHQESSVRTPQQNGVVERKNQTLIEAARTMLIFSRAPLFLWAEAIATACFTQNRSIIHRRFNKTPYELINGRKPDISFLHVFGALCYPKNDKENTVIRNKSRLVVGGYRQEEGLDFEESFAPDHFFKGIIDPTLFIRRFDNDILVSNYVLEILKKYGMESCDPVGTPMEIRDKLDLDQNETPVNATKYRSMDSGFELTGFSDVDYAGCKDTFKSTSGGAQFLGEKLVSWSSKKQDCTALSTAEAEYVSLSACCAQVLWMQTQLTDYGFNYNKIPIYCDSKSVIAISCNPVQHSRTKHIAVRYHFIKEHVKTGTIELYFVKTDYQLDDIFTKALPADRFNYLIRRLGMRSLSPQELDRLAKSQ
nr:integrase, catalytic region, zinc finger, CCHC-type, peptidase aspartic, catalytic [Tanacetum cinerariifolium]